MLVIIIYQIRTSYYDCYTKEWVIIGKGKKQNKLQCEDTVDTYQSTELFCMCCPYVHSHFGTLFCPVRGISKNQGSKAGWRVCIGTKYKVYSLSSWSAWPYKLSIVGDFHSTAHSPGVNLQSPVNGNSRAGLPNTPSSPEASVVA